ncbi:hypothetical protein V6N13_083451 [Hibiscus sabdariffa]|uniref:BURP domain-containing protein n=1 Tax=Hibiscus sabdariffa TaxID=183260 RepID=A0ABR2SYU3_9ROSI
MVIRFTYVVPSCLLLLMCGLGNATWASEDKYVRPYLVESAAEEMKDLEDKFSRPYFTKITDDEMKDLEDKFASPYFSKTNEMKDLEGKFARPYFSKTNEMKDLEDKFASPYFSKTSEMKGLEDKFASPYFSKTNEMKDLEEKYSRPYYSKIMSDVMKILKDRFARPYFTKTTGDEMKDLEGKFAHPYFSKTMGDKMKDLNDKFTRPYFSKVTNVEMMDLESKYARPYFTKSSSYKMKSRKHHDHNHDESAQIGLFTFDELRGFSVGKKLPIVFPIKDHSLYPPFLPKEVADTIPFSSSQVSNILQFFSVFPDSPKGKAIQDTLTKCELEAAEGETKICATSLESLHVSELPQEIDSQKKVACHPMPYLYAVYFCHIFEATETKDFKLQLVGDITGDKVDALVVCHMDTSGWSSDHVVFRMLGIKHGGALCHVFSQGNLVLIDEASAIAVSAV